MVTGWRKAFCTPVSKDTDSKALRKKHHQQHSDNDDTNQTPRSSSNFAFFSNPSTPRLRCRTSVANANPSSFPNSPRLHCSTAKASKKLSNPPSPKSPSSFSLLKASLRLSKRKCGICLQSVKARQGTAIFTAECSHTFHFHCVATHINKQQILLCPVCSTSWNELPSFSTQNVDHYKKSSEESRAHKLTGDIRTPKALKVYSDDEPLMSPTSVAFFNPIPESDENDDEVSEEESTEFQGFNVNPVRNPLFSPETKDIEMSLLPEAAIMAANRSYETYCMVLKVKAPPCRKLACRAPIDLVMALDVGGGMANSKLQMMKRLMRIVISSLGSSDRLSVVAFSSGSKRFFPLRRMTSRGQRSARRIVDTLAGNDGSPEGACFKHDALKKAAKVLEDRQEKSPVAIIVLLSDCKNECITNPLFEEERSHVSSTRLPHLDIPVHSVRLPGGGSTSDHAQPHHLFAKHLNGLLNLVARDLRLQLKVVSRPVPVEIAAVYSISGGPTAVGAGLARLGDLYADEERELLLELKVPAASAGSHHVLSVRSSYRDPSTGEMIYPKEHALLIPRPHAVRSSDPKIARLRNLHVTARAVAESRRLAEHCDINGAAHLLSSARALLLQSASKSAEEYLRWLEPEVSELQRRRQKFESQSLRSNRGEKLEVVTSTSAWGAAERLAEVAIMRKSMNRVSDLHGFENARF